jgi:hypothetical protein
MTDILHVIENIDAGTESLLFGSLAALMTLLKRFARKPRADCRRPDHLHCYAIDFQGSVAASSAHTAGSSRPKHSADRLVPHTCCRRLS